MTRFTMAIPVFHVSSAAAAEEFYCGRLGFRKEFAYSPGDQVDPCYMGVVRGGAWLHLSSFPGDSGAWTTAFVIVDDVDALCAELLEKQVAIDLKPTDQTWGNREMYVRDADGNKLAFVRLPK
ncbi:MAG TPA: VOC family protein [Candidatus Polarisedimenticolia bacterium]|jgi:catechol 2,3-dioxygenase-like lactoylglutathione lyase family enzyme|nr:VOC family protein [Candidatus Polarisedimenticolia bacterium]